MLAGHDYFNCAQLTGFRGDFLLHVELIILVLYSMS